MMIPITKPYLGKEEADAARRAILSGWVAQGPRVEEFEKAFASYVGAPYAAAVSNCTTALHLALLAVGVKLGDSVITVSHSFIATASSIRHSGAEPVFVDIDPATYNMSPESLEECLRRDCGMRGGQLFYRKAKGCCGGDGRVAAVMPVHQMGMPCDMARILAIARRYHLPVVEDAACALGSEITRNGRKAAERIGRPHGDIACFSFHPRKLITTGEGGMITTESAAHDRMIRVLRNQGMEMPCPKRGKAKRSLFEEYVTTGYNCRMTDIQAGIGIAQMKKLPRILKERRKVASLYRAGLEGIPWLDLPAEPSYCRTNWQSYPVRVRRGSGLGRDALIRRLFAAGISTRRGIMNAHQEPAYGSSCRLPQSEAARDSVILLPIYCGMRRRDIDAVIKEIADA